MRTDKTLAASVDELFAEWNGLESPGAALAVVKEGAVVYKHGYGMANLEYDVPITPTTVFDIASVSKQFTGFAIATLAHEGTLSLDADIRTYLSDVPDFGHTITVRHLLHHTSGLRDWVQSLVIAGDAMDDVISFKHILKMVRHQRALNFPPGTMFLYSNTGYNLLAEIVEVVTGESFRAWTDAHIFRPLAMTNTHFHDDYEMILKNRAYSYQAVEGGGFKHSVNNTTALGSSSLCSTVEDLAKWLLYFDNPQRGGEAIIDYVHEQGVLNNGERIDYGFGVHIGAYRTLKKVEHSGSWRGFRSHVVRFPNQRFGVVVLCNLGGIHPLALTERVADLYLADVLGPVPASEPKETASVPESGAPEPLAAAELAEFEGDYYTTELDTTYMLRVCGDQLVAYHRRHDDIRLTYAGDHFIGDVWFFPEIRFERDGDGRVTGFRLTGNRVGNLYFERRRKAVLLDI